MKLLLLILALICTFISNAQTLNTTNPLLIDGGNSATLGASNSLTLSGIAGYGSASQIWGMNTAGTALEWKTLTIGTFGTDFNIASTTGLITFNLPDASTSNRGAVNMITQTFAGPKTFNSDLTVSGTNTNLFLPDGVDDDNPSIAFTNSTTTGLYLTTGSDTRINVTVAGNKRAHFTADGSFSITNNTDFNNQLDLNISHDATIGTAQDGGINVTTYGGPSAPYKTSTFTGRVASGSSGTPAQTKNNQAMAEFSGKGWCTGCASGGTDGFQTSNKGVFGVYAGINQTSSNQATYLGLKTTRINGTANHMSLMIDPGGNAGLTTLETGSFGTSTPNGWSVSDESRYFSIEANNTTTNDAGLLIQNSNGSRGLNIWFDNSSNVAYLDNIRNSDATILQTRFKTYIGGTPIVAMSSGVFDQGGGTIVGGTNFGTDTSPDNVLTVGSTSQFQVNGTGMIVKYNDIITESNGVPSIYEIKQDPSQTAATGVTPIYSVPSDGMYRISWVCTILSTTAGSSTLGPFQIHYTDANGDDPKTWPAANINNFNQTIVNTVANGVISGCMTVYAASGTDIQFQIGYATGGGGTMEYDYNIICERL